MRLAAVSLALVLAALSSAPANAAPPDCSRSFTLALHDHGLLYSSQTGEGIDKDFADELIRRSGCQVSVTVMPRAHLAAH
jgi:polar amino acid transport system substrate-binding protein